MNPYPFLILLAVIVFLISGPRKFNFGLACTSTIFYFMFGRIELLGITVVLWALFVGYTLKQLHDDANGSYYRRGF